MVIDKQNNHVTIFSAYIVPYEFSVGAKFVVQAIKVDRKSFSLLQLVEDFKGFLFLTEVEIDNEMIRRGLRKANKIFHLKRINKILIM